MTEGLTKNTGHPVRYAQILFIPFIYQKLLETVKITEPFSLLVKLSSKANHERTTGELTI